jgi:choice-of-anchor A domain-containing protein
VKLTRDAEGHVIGFGRISRVASSFGAGWGAFQYGDDGPFVVQAWNGRYSGVSVHGLYAYKDGDFDPGKFVDYRPLIGQQNAVSSKVVPPGYAGAGKLKAVMWPFGEWYSGTIVPTADGYVDVTSLSAVPSRSLVGRPHDFSFVPQGSPGFSQDSILVSELSANVLAAYQLDANGDPIIASRRPMVQGLADPAGGAFDPISGDFILQRYGGNGSEQRALAVRGFRNPERASDLTASRAAATLDTAGRVTAVSFRIGNAGSGTARESRVGIHAVRNGTRGEVLAQIVVPPLAMGEFRDYTQALVAPTTVPGVMIVADDGEALYDCGRANNTAVIAVQSLLGTVQARTDLPAYEPGGVVEIGATISNPGPVVAGYSVALTVIDSAGGLVADLGQKPVDALASGASASVGAEWTVPNLVAGTYRVKAVLRNLLNDTLGESSAAFEVLAVPTSPVAVVKVTTDKPSYGAFDVVAVNARLSNAQGNAVLSGLVASLRVTGPGGAVFFTLDSAVPTLAALAGVDIGFGVSLSGAAPGSYGVEIVVRDATGAILAAESSFFVVESSSNTGAEVTGTIVLSNAEVAQGGSLAIAAAVTNGGNADMAGLQMQLTALDPANGAILQQWTQVVAAPRNVAVPFPATWNVPGALPPATYTVALSITVGGVERTLAQGNVVVRALPIAISSTLATDKAAYDPQETVAISASVTNAAGGRPLASIRFRHRVLDGTGSVLSSQDGAPFDLPAGSTVSRVASFAVGTIAPGAHTVEQSVIDGAGVVLDSRQVPFQIRSTAVTGVGVSGTVVASPGTANAGSTISLTATLLNAGNADLVDAPVRISVRDAAQGVVVEFASSLSVSRSAPAVYASSWVTPATLPAGAYGVTLQVTLGGETRALATAPVTIQAAAPTATLAVTSVPKKGLLVLVSCSGSAANAIGAGTPDTPACVSSRRAAIETILAELGVPAVVTANADEFRRLLRCGDYDRYWIAGGAEKMRGTLAEEVREAVLGGAALYVDGYQDTRSRVFDEATGVTPTAKLAGATNVIGLAGILGSGSVTVPGAFVAVTPLAGVTVQGTFSNGSPAVTTSAYGQGRTAFFAFDLAGALAASPASAPLRALVESMLREVPPAAASGPQLAGSSLDVGFVVSNGGAAGTYRVEATLPTGSAASALSPGGVVSGNSATWDLALAANESRALSFTWDLPAVAGDIVLPVRLVRIEGATATEVDAGQVSIAAATGDGLRGSLVADLAALSLSGSAATARDAAVQKIGGGWTKVTQGNVDGAIVDYLAANTELAKIVAPPTLGYEARVARLIEDAGARACTARLACAAPAWAPSSYSVLVFGSASMSNGQTAGPVGVGGAASISSYAVANTLSGDAARLAVAGSLSFGSGSVGIGGTGSIRVGGAASVTQSVGRRELLTGVATENFTALKTWYQTLSTRIGQLPGTAAAHDGFGKYTLTGTSPTLNVFTISGTALDSGHSLYFQVPDSASVILNVTGTAAAFTNGQSYWNGVGMQNHPRAARILYNFPAAVGVSASGWSPQGTILAPNAAVTLSNGNVNGAIVVNTLTTSSAALACPAFEGTLPASVMPSP